MSEQYEKYLKSLPKKEREKIKSIIDKILQGDLSNIDYIELAGKK
jgi:mRNA-degrading endonuclease RelE of RelBE toxin-antitoxin system